MIKKIIKILVPSLLLFTMIGCAKEPSIDLDDYYLELTKEDLNELSLNEIKTDLSSFKYDKEVYKNSNEEVTDEDRLDEPSYHKFISGEEILEVKYNEKTKKVNTISFQKQDDNNIKKIAYTGSFVIASLNSPNTKSINNTLDKLNLNKSLQNIMNLHLELVQKLNNNQVVDLEEVKNMFELEEIDKEHYKESNMMEYVFNSKNEYIDSMRIDISDTDKQIKDMRTDILNKDLNYQINMYYSSHKVNFAIYPSRDDIMDNEEGVLKFIRKSNRELFDLLFNGEYINIQKLNQ
ncbi:hypothetical protein [Terrisporobacter vanillatitrophus]|uniref:hypothetical protein n=1 Tax=Terrisporobacter vanillatitrophus TaxID=3058402 RepID=UPI0033666181